jgi:hypothetical protein
VTETAASRNARTVFIPSLLLDLDIRVLDDLAPLPDLGAARNKNLISVA